MKVVHVSKYDCKGGAALAALNAVRTQREIGIDAVMMAGRKLGSEPFVEGPDAIGNMLALARFAAERLPARLSGIPSSDPRSMGFWGIRLKPVLERLKPDIVVFHNIDGVIRLADIPSIKAPVVWRMHDAWPLLGTKHYELATRPVRFPRQFEALDRWVWRNKTSALTRHDSMSLVPPSNWLAQLARSRLPSLSTTVIPNGIDTTLFSPPPERREARRELGLRESDFVILFGAAAGATDPRKGFDLLARALEAARDPILFGNVVLATFGGKRPDSRIAGIPVVNFGTIHDRAKLAALYGAADISIVPSREENLSLTVLESLACGTPVIAFGIGGMPDMIETGANGWLVPPYDTGSLAATISSAKDQGDKLERMRIAARNTVVEKFDRFGEARQMLSLFESLLA